MKRLIVLMVLAALTILVAGDSSAFAGTTTFGPIPNQPEGITIDDDGNIYLSSFTDDVVTKVLADGTLAGSPWPVTVGDQPYGVAVDASGYVYVANSNSNTVTRISPAGVASGSAGDNYRWADTQSYPLSVVLDKDGNIYATNYFSASVTRISPAGVSDLAWGQTGINPRDIAFDLFGNLYTPNVFTDDVSKISSSGEPAGTPWPVATGDQPSAVAVDWERNLYVAYVGPSSGVAKIAPSGTTEGSPWPASVGTSPTDIAIDSNRNLYVTNFGSQNVTKIEPDGSSSTIASTPGGPNAITIDASGNLYTANSAFVSSVTKISPGGGTADIAPAPPATPSTPTATAGAGSATVTVDPNPVSARYGAPSSYLVEVAQDGSKTCTVTPPATSCKITGLTPGSIYRFSAKAVLNAWVTNSSEVSNEVTPNPQTISVSGLKPRVSRTSVILSSKATVSGAGRISQTAKASGRTWCSTSKTVSTDGMYTLTCRLGRKARRAIRSKALSLTVKTVLAPTAGSAVSKTSKITIRRKR